MERSYKDHRMRYSAEFNPDAKHWTPRLLVFWNEGNQIIEKSILFKVAYAKEEEAQNHALQFGMKWIDDGKPELPER